MRRECQQSPGAYGYEYSKMRGRTSDFAGMCGAHMEYVCSGMRGMHAYWKVED